MSDLNYAYGTTAGSTYSISVSPTVGTERPRTPSGLIVTRAVETKDGWMGQVLVDKEIVFQGDACEDGEDAIKEANALVVSVVKGLFISLGDADPKLDVA